jgi:hypothetical protein
MLSNTKIALVAALIAVVATPALARDSHKARHVQSDAVQSQRFFEGRNAAPVYGYDFQGDTGSYTGREALIHAN